MSDPSIKPYLLRALYEWCADHGYTPHIAVYVDQHTRVPKDFVKNNEIVLNISMDATHELHMGNEWIEFNARFAGHSHKIEVPITNIVAIYALENGQGMAFPVDKESLASVQPGEQEIVATETQANLLKPVSTKAKQESKKDKAKTNNKNKPSHLTIVK